MNRPDLNTLSKEVFEANKAKGFHDVELSNETLLMLVITELSEAVEADRKSKRANLERFLKRIETSRSYKGLIPEITPDRAYEVIYNETIKGSIEEELADAVIRLLDLAGLRGCDHLKDLLLCPTVSDKKNFPDNIFAICTDLIYYKYTVSERISFALLNIEYLCKLLSIDLWQHVSLKLKYNQTRPIKHGKNY
ncbi:hypothetical protein [Dysgonomonas capnocytophagoides]|uniref:hypothetical protein n=1 Tax=Dysgonomonas capnocytophagoides TaxID=45254 RepID=UPI00292278D3|nr:hypothetical protein DCPSUM001_33120 [Dysgonomonas capnocytophagoides]